MTPLSFSRRDRNVPMRRAFRGPAQRLVLVVEAGCELLPTGADLCGESDALRCSARRSLTASIDRWADAISGFARTSPLAARILTACHDHGDPIAGEGPQGFLEAIVEFLLPFAFQELDDLGATMQEVSAVPPLGVLRRGVRLLTASELRNDLENFELSYCQSEVKSASVSRSLKLSG